MVEYSRPEAIRISNLSNFLYASHEGGEEIYGQMGIICGTLTHLKLVTIASSTSYLGEVTNIYVFHNLCLYLKLSSLRTPKIVDSTLVYHTIRYFERENISITFMWTRVGCSIQLLGS